MALEDTLAMLKGLTGDIASEDVDQCTVDGLWDYATRLWITQREEQLKAAVAGVSGALLQHDPAIGLLALYVVANKVRQASRTFEWVDAFNGALLRVADDLVPVPVTPGRPGM